MGNKMRIYEYECEDGHRFEEAHRIDDRYNASCPECTKPVHIRISLSNFVMIEPIHVLQEHHDGSHTEVNTIYNAPKTEPPRPHGGNLVEV